jgi:hypothetical protein
MLPLRLCNTWTYKYSARLQITKAAHSSHLFAMHYFRHSQGKLNYYQNTKASITFLQNKNTMNPGEHRYSEASRGGSMQLR